MSREQDLASAFVDLADTLVSDYDVADLMHRLVEHAVGLLSVSQAGLLLSDQRGSLHVMASTTEQTKLLELFQIQAKDGPCLDCYRTGRGVAVADLEKHSDRWPNFTPVAVQIGFRAVHTFPMRLREQTIGALNLFNTEPGALSEDNGHIAQALADIATIGLLQERAIHESGVVVTQLEGALSSRVLIEQAKGVIAEQEGVSMDEAFQRLRGRARNANRRLADVAQIVVSTAGDPAAEPVPTSEN
jgi:GAF domain-containing protein